MKKNDFVKSVFSSVANKYDVMNNLMSLGIHHLWKNELIKEINPRNNFNLLDVAGGTGDITMRILKQFHNCKATVCDNNFDMIEQGIEKTISKGYVNIDWVCGDAEQLPFFDDYFDYYTIAFGIRNVANINVALTEANRVLKPGGRFLCLEFSHMESNFLLSKLYELYSNNIIPLLGKVVTGHKEAYQYLIDSIRSFPTQRGFADLLIESNFTGVTFRNLTKGIVSIHTGWKTSD